MHHATRRSGLQGSRQPGEVVARFLSAWPHLCRGHRLSDRAQPDDQPRRVVEPMDCFRLGHRLGRDNTRAGNAIGTADNWTDCGTMATITNRNSGAVISMTESDRLWSKSSRFHPLEIIPWFRRFPYSWWRDLIYTFIWNCLLAVFLVSIVAMLTSKWPGVAWMIDNLIIANCIG